jgi:hypothetical protein
MSNSLTLNDMICKIEQICEITEKSNEEKLSIYEEKYNDLLRKHFAGLITYSHFKKQTQIAVDCINFYREKMGFCSFEEALEMLSTEDNPDEVLMVNPDLVKYAGTEKFHKIPIIVCAFTENKIN